MRHRVTAVLLALLLPMCGGGGGDEEAPPGSPQLRITTGSLPEATVGQAYAVTVEALGGTGVGRAWRLASGALPAGLVLEGGAACLDWSSWETVGEVDADVGTGVLTEISGLAASRLNPGVLWAHDDSGGTATLYALRADGTVRARIALDATPHDWEDVAIGPGPDPEASYLYVGDIGDNVSGRAHVTLLRVVEPVLGDAPGEPIALPHEAFVLAYVDGPRNAEALVLDPDSGTPYLLEKSTEGGNAYRAPMPLSATWTPTSPGTLTPVTTSRPLPVDVTAADAAPGGNRVLLRTYSGGVELVRPPGAAFEAIFSGAGCDFSVPFIGQYESLTVAPDGTALYTTTERVLSSVPLSRAIAAPRARPAVIRGTPTGAGSATLTLEVEESSGEKATRTFDLLVR